MILLHFPENQGLWFKRSFLHVTVLLKLSNKNMFMSDISQFTSKAKMNIFEKLTSICRLPSEKHFLINPLIWAFALRQNCYATFPNCTLSDFFYSTVHLLFYFFTTSFQMVWLTAKIQIAATEVNVLTITYA